jgi:hypothetical protein
MIGRLGITLPREDEIDDAFRARVNLVIDGLMPGFEWDLLPGLLEAGVARMLRFDLAPKELLEQQLAGVVILDGKEIIVRHNSDGTATPYYRGHPDGDSRETTCSRCRSTRLRTSHLHKSACAEPRASSAGRSADTGDDALWSVNDGASGGVVMAERDQAHESLRGWSTVAPAWEASRQRLFENLRSVSGGTASTWRRVNRPLAQLGTRPFGSGRGRSA